MKLPGFTLLLLALCTSVPSSADSVAARPDRAAIQTAYDGIAAAFAQHDIPRMMSYMAPDYAGVNEKGVKFDREQAQRQFQGQTGQIKSIQSHYVVQAVTPSPAGTLMEIKLYADGMGEKRVLFAKLHARFTDYLWVRDLWVNTPQGCRLKYRQTLADEMRIHPR